jgi:polyhydroxybutyrate depolymerase
MVGVLACELSDAFAPVAGAFHPRPTTCTPSRPVPILEIHGLDDHVVVYAGQGPLPPIQEWLAGWATRNGCSLGAPVITGDRSVWPDCAAPVEHIAVPGQPHDYPSSSAEWICEFFTRTVG